jgi:hypothetical protein
MKRFIRSGGLAFAAGLMLVLAGAGTSEAVSVSWSTLTPMQKRIISGTAALELQSANTTRPQKPDNYFPRGSDACAANLQSNIKVNQNCLNITDPDLAGRGSANNETSILQDPNDPNNVVATSNDYRRGDTNCWVSYSSDKARTWNDAAIPMGFTRGDAFGVAREYWQAGGDPVVAWDAHHNAYFVCLQFQRGGGGFTGSADASSAIYVYRSTLNHGASWNFPGRPVVESADIAGQGAAFEDKPWITADSTPSSPFHDRVYVTWTEFALNGTAYVYESYSSDYGEHFSERHLVSADSNLCVPATSGPSGRCDENEFAQPFVGADGALYVVFANYNSIRRDASDNRNQILLAKSADGGNTFSAPVKVSDYYDLPDCATYQDGKDFGTACIPEKGPTSNSYFRASNYPSGGVNPTNPNQVVVTFGSYINAHSSEANGCVPAGVSPATLQPLYTGVKTPGACNNDILVSVSNNGGATFTGTVVDPRTLVTATQDPQQGVSDQWFQWIGFTKNGKLATSYYDRQYGDDETTGFSDVSLSGSGDLTRFGVQRVTSGSMPPPTQFEGTFWGDYAGLSAVDNAYPMWSDTRNPELYVCPSSAPPTACGASADNAAVANDQDAYTAALSVPSR